MHWLRLGSRLFVRFRPRFALLALLVAVLGAPATLPAQRVAVQVEDANRNPAQQSWMQLLYRDRRHVTYLDAADRALADGRETEALQYLQWLLDQGEDSFFWDPRRQRVDSVHEEVQRRLNGLAPNVLRHYEALEGPTASRLLNEAQEAGSLELYQRLVRRFFHTKAGFRAANWLATHWADNGEAGLAARMWNRLLSCPVHQNRLTPEMLLKAGVANRLAHEDAEPSTLARQLKGSERVKVAGRPVDPSAWLSQAKLNHLFERPLADWPIMLGNAERNPAPNGSAPLLHPNWTRSLAATVPYRVESAIETWEQARLAEQTPAAVASLPIIVGDLLVARDFEGLRAINLQSGAVVWRYRAETSLMKSVGSAGVRQTFEEVFADNAVLGTLASDGQRVFALDSMDFAHAVDRRMSLRGIRLPEEPTARTNRLLAFDLVPSETGRDGSATPVWSIGGVSDDDPQPAFSEHFFLGPPLPLGGLLFVIAEAEGQINLLALDPENGRQVWSQPLAVAELPIHQHPERWRLACSPSFAAGVLVCPTQVGVLVGVDATNGSLLWSYYYGDRQEQPRITRQGYTILREARGTLSLPNLPQIHGTRVIDLPPHSERLHCLDLFTGNPHWSVDRDGADYVAAVTDRLIVVVGSNRCRGLALEDGREVWSREIGLPSGRGILVGDSYLIPLAEGRVARISVTTGEETGYTLLKSEVTPGNLIAHGDAVISVNARTIASFPQTAGLRKRLAAEPATRGNSAERQVLAAELDLTEGRLVAAVDHLQAALAAAPSAALRDRTEELLRECLHLELKLGQRPEDEVLAQLDPLARTPTERGRFLMRLTSRELERGDFDRLLESVQELSQLELSDPLPVADDPALRVSTGAWVRHVLNRAETRFDVAEQQRLRDELQVEQQRLLQTGDLPGMRRFLSAYPQSPEAVAVRFHMAEQLTALGRLHEAELLLLPGRQSTDPALAAEATRRMLELWDRSALPFEAAGLLGELNQTFADIRLSDGQTGREYVARFPRESLTWSAFTRRQPQREHVSRVVIRPEQRTSFTLGTGLGSRGQPWTESGPTYESLFKSHRRALYPLAQETLHLIVRGSGAETALVVLDKEAGVQVGELSIPPTYLNPTMASSSAFVGHYFPLGVIGEVQGISLLEVKSGSPVWKRPIPSLPERTSMPQIGPAGPGFAVFQVNGHLFALDPSDGHVLWHRNDLNVRSGLQSSLSAGLFGDEQVLVVFDTDRTSYTVLETATGMVRRRGRLDVQTNQPSIRSFGRLLYYNVTTRAADVVGARAADARYRLWDPLDDQIVLDEPYGSRPFMTTTDDDELVILTRDGRLMVFDPQAREVRLNLPFDASEWKDLSSLRAFSDRHRYYVNFQRTTQALGTANPQSYANDTFVATNHLRDDLLAIDRTSGRILWRRVVPQRTVLELPAYELPFLVMVARVRDRNDASRQSLLLEAVDAATGLTIGTASDVPYDRIAHVSCDHTQGRLTLHGLTSEIHLDFAPQWQAIGTD